MTARSVAEILPKPFDHLALDDVAEILRRVGEQGESVFFERKLVARSDLLAKSCSAFANTMGGLLIAGVPDDSDEPIGIEANVAEPQTWVKDLLRGSVIPIPPFRARRVDVSDGRWLLLVLVEESSTTPHFTSQGAIYVRNPSSSDPVPVSEQRTLFELIERGRIASDRAIGRASELVGTQPSNCDLVQTLALVPSGMNADAVRQLELLDPSLARARALLAVRQDIGAEYDLRQDSLRLIARVPIPAPASGVLLPQEVRGARIYHDGAVVAHDALAPDQWQPAVELDDVRTWILDVLHGARHLLLELGAHGDLRLAWKLVGGRGALMYGPSLGASVDRDITIGEWTRLDPDEGADEAMLIEIEAELLRALRVPPGHRPRLQK